MRPAQCMHAHAAAAPDRPSRHGRVLCVGRAVALPGAARPAGGDRRRAAARSRCSAPTARASSRRCATTPAAASSPPRPTRRATFGVHSAHGPDEGRAARARRRAAAGRFRRVPHVIRACFKAAVRAKSRRCIEDRGIDEIYIDLTDVPGVRDVVGHDPLGGVRAVAQEIKNSVRDATGLTCSIGVTPNKLLSKIASELDKPDGLTILLAGRRRGAHLAAAGAQDQRHRPEGGREARCARHRDGRRARRGRRRDAGRAIRRELRRVAARRRARPATSGRSSRTASRCRSAARRPSSATCMRCATAPQLSRDLHRAVRASSPATCSARATSGERSASSCASTTSRPSRATTRSTRRPRTRR